MRLPDTPPLGFKPMEEFDATKPALVSDGLNNRIFLWRPEKYAATLEKVAGWHDEGEQYAPLKLAPVWSEALGA